jgi:hypothetical protein
VLHTLLAFANTAGGTLVVGVDDRTKHVRGIADSLKEEERLANLVSDSILPRLNLRRFASSGRGLPTGRAPGAERVSRQGEREGSSRLGEGLERAAVGWALSPPRSSYG